MLSVFLTTFLLHHFIWSEKNNNLSISSVMTMKFSRIFFIGSIATLLLFVVVSVPVQADVIGSTYSFSATWFEHSYQVDNTIVQQELYQGTFQIYVYNITPADAYEYTFTGMNSNFDDDTPYYDQMNQTTGFDDNTVSFDLQTEDDDANGRAEVTGINIHPFYHHSNPGGIIFVDPVWVTHNSEWNTAVADAESEDAFQSITESADDGSFSFQIVVDIEIDHPDYGILNGTATFSFSASYDTDGVLNNWGLTQIRSLQNDNHTITDTQYERYARGTGSGPGFVGSSDLAADIAIAGLSLVGGLVIGVVIAKRYWG